VTGQRKRMPGFIWVLTGPTLLHPFIPIHKPLLGIPLLGRSLSLTFHFIHFEKVSINLCWLTLLLVLEWPTSSNCNTNALRHLFTHYLYRERGALHHCLEKGPSSKLFLSDPTYGIEVHSFIQQYERRMGDTSNIVSKEKKRRHREGKESQPIIGRQA